MTAQMKFKTISAPTSRGCAATISVARVPAITNGSGMVAQKAIPWKTETIVSTNIANSGRKFDSTAGGRGIEESEVDIGVSCTTLMHWHPNIKRRPSAYI